MQQMRILLVFLFPFVHLGNTIVKNLSHCRAELVIDGGVIIFPNVTPMVFGTSDDIILVLSNRRHYRRAVVRQALEASNELFQVRINETDFRVVGGNQDIPTSEWGIILNQRLVISVFENLYASNFIVV